MNFKEDHFIFDVQRYKIKAEVFNSDLVCIRFFYSKIYYTLPTISLTIIFLRLLKKIIIEKKQSYTNIKIHISKNSQTLIIKFLLF